MSRAIRTVFLGGPIQHAVENDGFNALLERDILRTIDLLEAEGFVVRSAHRAEEFGRLQGDLRPRLIAHRDFLWVKECDAYVAIIPSTPSGRLMQTDGTHVEMGWASALGKRIVLAVDQQCTRDLSLVVLGLRDIRKVDLIEFDGRQGCDGLPIVRALRRSGGTARLAAGAAHDDGLMAAR